MCGFALYRICKELVKILTATGEKGGTLCLGLNKLLKGNRSYTIKITQDRQTTVTTIDSNTLFKEREETVVFMDTWDIDGMVSYTLQEGVVACCPDMG